MNIVIVGHVDHGKSTVIGRLLADTNSLPQGKLERVKEYCANNSKPFEYAFLLDALKDEQSQGITIDSARCFFQSQKRDYIIIDAPGHIEFLKNMVTGATRAEAAVLVIDADEGIQENSKRHGYLLSMLGIKQIIICVNKMDLVNYNQEVFNKIKQEFTEFLKKIQITPKEFIPVSALEGDNIIQNSENLNWFQGNNILTALDSFEKQPSSLQKPFRMPIQDIYKFTKNQDNRRVIAGKVESGTIEVGDEVIFLPSNKISSIKKIVELNKDKVRAKAGESTSFILNEQIYVKRGEVMSKLHESKPYVSKFIKTNIFWMEKTPMLLNKEYAFKLGTAKIPVRLKEIKNVLNASNLDNFKKEKIDRHEVAECVLELEDPVCFDLVKDLEALGRFVIVDDYEIAGGGIITDFLTGAEFEKRKHKTIWFTGRPCSGKTTIAKRLEQELKKRGLQVAHLDGDDVRRKLNADLGFSHEDRKENLRRIAYVSDLFNKKGNHVIASFVSPENDLREMIREVIQDMHLVYINCSLEEAEKRDVKGMYAKARRGEIKNFTGIDAPFEIPINPDLVIDTVNNNVETCVKQIIEKFDL